MSHDAAAAPPIERDATGAARPTVRQRAARLMRFRLRTLLWVLTVAAVWLGFLANSARLQQKSVAAIQKYGGWVRYDFQFPDGDYSPIGFDSKARSWAPKWWLDQLGVDLLHSVVQVNLNYSDESGKRQENGNRSDEALQFLEGFPNLRVLLLWGGQATDSSMSHLAHLHRLQYLFMWDVSEVTDRGAANLKGLKDLRYIHLSASQISDKTLEVFGGMPQLEGLSLQFNHFTDAGLEHVAGLRKLRFLWVCGRHDRPNQITDVGLKRLHGLKNLTQLGIQFTSVTPEGVAEFSCAVRGCKVSR
jgi:hypothetical protein